MEIESGVPIPEAKPTGRGTKYPWKDMKVGDSLHFTNQQEYERARTASSAYGKKHGLKFTARMTLDGYRIWRIK